MLSKNEIVEQLAKNKEVEKIVKKFYTENKDDLVQYIYLSLLQMDDNRIINLYEENRLKYYIVGVIKHQVMSKTSYHIKDNAKAGITNIVCEPFYDETKDYVLDDDTPPHQYEDNVDAALSALSEVERDIILCHQICLQNRKPHIDKVLEKHNLTYSQYQHLVPLTKLKFAKMLNIKFKYKTLEKKEHKHRKKKEIEQYDRNMNLIKLWKDGVEAASELGLNTGSIYKVCQGKRKTYNGFIWKYKIN